MTKKILTVLAAVGALTSLSACMNDGSTLPAPGTYKTTNKSTDSNGTDYSKQTTTTVTADQYGNKSATSKTTTTKDPKGLMNKSTTTSTSSTAN